MFVTFKQFTRYPSQQQNRIGLSKITSRIHQIDLSPSQIDGRAFFCQKPYLQRLFSFSSHHMRLGDFLLTSFDHFITFIARFFFLSYPLG